MHKSKKKKEVTGHQYGEYRSKSPEELHEGWIQSYLNWFYMLIWNIDTSDY